MRGTIPYVAYRAFEIGWTASVAVAIVIGPASPSVPPGGITWASSARPMPAAWISGETNSIERNQRRSRTTDADERDHLVLVRSRRRPGRPPRSAPGSVVARWR